jgi:acetyl esterase/lipase
LRAPADLPSGDAAMPLPSLPALPWRWLALLPLLLALSWAWGGASHDYRIVRGLVYTPPGWPQALAGDLYLPERRDAAPVVLVVHGGSWSSGSRTSLDATRIARHLAAQGYAAFSVDYRLAPAALYPAPLEDLPLAVAWLRAHAAEYRLDGDALGAWGYSAGAHLVALLGTQANAQLRLRAVVAGGIPADLTRWPDSPLVKKFLGRNAREDFALSAAASPINHIDDRTAPFFLYHGARDSLVEPEQPRLFAAALRTRGIPVELYYRRYAGHLLTAALPGKALDKGTAFLAAHLLTAPAGETLQQAPLAARPTAAASNVDLHQ